MNSFMLLTMYLILIYGIDDISLVEHELSSKTNKSNGNNFIFSVNTINKNCIIIPSLYPSNNNLLLRSYNSKILPKYKKNIIHKKYSKKNVKKLLNENIPLQKEDQKILFLISKYLENFRSSFAQKRKRSEGETDEHVEQLEKKLMDSYLKAKDKSNNQTLASTKIHLKIEQNDENKMTKNEDKENFEDEHTKMTLLLDDNERFDFKMGEEVKKKNAANKKPAILPNTKSKYQIHNKIKPKPKQLKDNEDYPCPPNECDDDECDKDDFFENLGMLQNGILLNTIMVLLFAFLIMGLLMSSIFLLEKYGDYGPVSGDEEQMQCLNMLKGTDLDPEANDKLLKEIADDSALDCLMDDEGCHCEIKDIVRDYDECKTAIPKDNKYFPWEEPSEINCVCDCPKRIRPKIDDPCEQFRKKKIVVLSPSEDSESVPSLYSQVKEAAEVLLCQKKNLKFHPMKPDQKPKKVETPLSLSTVKSSKSVKRKTLNKKIMTDETGDLSVSTPTISTSSTSKSSTSTTTSTLL